MRFFIRFFIFLLLAGGAAYGFAWYKNKQAVDNFIVQSGGSYDSTYIDFNGDSVVKGINFQMPGLSQAATIEELRTGTGNILTNVKVSKALDGQDFESLPDHFDIYFDVKGVKIPLDSSMDQGQGANEDFFSNATFAGCGSRKEMTTSDLMAIGITNLAMDAKVSLTMDKPNNRAYTDVYLNLDKFNTSKINLSFSNFSINNPMGLALSNGSIEVSDNGIQRDIHALCAKESELTPSQFTERHISYLKHLLFGENVFLSPEFYQAYAEYFSNPRSIKFTFNPTKDVQPMSLMGASPRRLMSLLNLNVSLNDQEVTPLLGNRPDPSELPQLDEVTPEDDGLRTVYGLKVQPTAVSSIGSYIGYDAYFNYRRTKYKGQIRSVTDTTANIRYEVSTGNYVEKPFVLADISNLRVRREQAQPKEEK